MTIETLKKLGQATLTGPGTQDLLYTVGATIQTMIKSIHIANIGAADSTIKIWHDGTANVNVILPPVTIPSGEWGLFSGVILMEPNDTLYAEAGEADCITVTLHGVEFS